MACQSANPQAESGTVSSLNRPRVDDWMGASANGGAYGAKMSAGTNAGLTAHKAKVQGLRPTKRRAGSQPAPGVPGTTSMWTTSILPRPFLQGDRIATAHVPRLWPQRGLRRPSNSALNPRLRPRQFNCGVNTPVLQRTKGLRQLGTTREDFAKPARRPGAGLDRDGGAAGNLRWKPG